MAAANVQSRVRATVWSYSERDVHRISVAPTFTRLTLAPRHFTFACDAAL